MSVEERGSTLPRVGLVSNDEIRIAGVEAALSGVDGAEVVRLSNPGMVEGLRLELVLIDSSSTTHLLELLSLFHRMRPGVRLIVLGGTSDAKFMEQAITVGARGMLNHDASEEELRMAIKVVCEGSVWAPREVLSRLLDRANHTRGLAHVHLTARELEVLRLLVSGLSNREIAARLDIEPATVKAHLGRLMRKAGVTNRTALGTHALKESWV